MKTIVKRALSLLSVAAIAATGFTASLGFTASAAAVYPWSETETTGNYIADSFTGLTEDNVFRAVPQERLRDILVSEGDFYIVFGGPKNASSQAALPVINAEAKKKGITQIYLFDTLVDDYQIDITDADSIWKTTAGPVSDIWKAVTDLFPANSAVTNYDSSTTLLIHYNKANASKVVDSYTYKNGTVDASAVSAVFTTPSSERSDFDFISRVFNAGATIFNYNGGTATSNKTGEETTTLFTEADRENFALRVVTLAELFDVINSKGDHVILFAEPGCHNTQAVIASVAQKARENKIDTVYYYDPELGNGQIYDENGEVITNKANNYVTRNKLDVSTGANNVSYLYAELANRFGPFLTENESKQNNSINYYPNGDVTAEPTSTDKSGYNAADAIRLQVPFLFEYNKDKNPKVTKQWIHKNAANDGTYTEYMLEHAWVLGTEEAKNAVDNNGDPKKIDGLSYVDFAAEGIAALDDVLKRDYPVSVDASASAKTEAAIDRTAKSYSFTVTNTGDYAIEVNALLSGANADAFEAKIVRNGAEVSSLAAGESAEVLVTVKDGVTGAATATVTVNSRQAGVIKTLGLSYTDSAADGTGAATTSTTSAATSATTSTASESPKTGEAGNVALASVALISVVIGLGALILGKKKRALTK